MPRARIAPPPSPAAPPVDVDVGMAAADLAAGRPGWPPHRRRRAGHPTDVTADRGPTDLVADRGPTDLVADRAPTLWPTGPTAASPTLRPTAGTVGASDCDVRSLVLARTIRNLSGVWPTNRVTAPRRILPGQTHFITRRSTQRSYLLRPDEMTTEIFEYCLAEAAHMARVQLVAWLAMSNHYHAVVHDPEGLGRPRQFHKMVAKALNARWGRWENLWSSEETCVTHSPTAADIFEKVVYVLANPVAAHLVDRVKPVAGCLFLEASQRLRDHSRSSEFVLQQGRQDARIGGAEDCAAASLCQRGVVPIVDRTHS